MEGECKFYCLFVFFFKQKTAYEMRISDWSSDVCSSDLESVMSTREAAIEAVEAYFDSGGFRDELAARVAVPSSSREEEHRPDLLAYQERLMRDRKSKRLNSSH